MATPLNLLLSALLLLLLLLKDPAKPKAKGNFWTVDVSCIPSEALKLQNTPVSRQQEVTFVHDLTPYVIHGHPYTASSGAPPVARPLPAGGGAEAPRPRRSSSFTIEAMLSNVHKVDSSPEPGSHAAESSPSHTSGPNSQGHSLTTGSSSSLSGGSSFGTCSPTSPPHRLHACGCEACCVPVVCQFPIMPWGQLPTSYTANIASVLTPFPLPPLFAFPATPALSSCPPYNPAASVDPAYWNMVAAPCSMPLLGCPLGQQYTQQAINGALAPSWASPPWRPPPGSAAPLNTGSLQAAADAPGRLPTVHHPWQPCLPQPPIHALQTSPMKAP